MKYFAALTVLTLGLSACQSVVTEGTGEAGPKETIGLLSGAVVGGTLANQASQGSDNQALFTMAGLLAGAIIGGDIGASLDQLDRQMQRATYEKVMESPLTNQAMTWSNPDSGNSGSVMATRNYYTETATGRTYCREYTQEIMVGGTKQQGYGVACQMPDGSWKIQG